MALAIRHQTGDRLGQVKDLPNIGNVHRIQGEFDRSIQDVQMALDIARAGGYQRDRSLALAALGLAYQWKGDLPQALAFQTQAIQIAEALADPEVLWRLYGDGVTLTVY